MAALVSLTKIEFFLGAPDWGELDWDETEEERKLDRTLATYSEDEGLFNKGLKYVSAGKSKIKIETKEKMHKNSSTNKKMGGLQPVERAMPNLRRSAGNSEGLFLISLEGNVRWTSLGLIALAIFFLSHTDMAQEQSFQ